MKLTLGTNLVLLLLLRGKLLLQVGPRLHSLPRLSVCDEQRFGKLREALVDVNLLEPPPVGREPLVERDGVALLILPVGDAGRDLPVLLLLHRHLPRRRVHDRRGWRRWP